MPQVQHIRSLRGALSHGSLFFGIILYTALGAKVHLIKFPLSKILIKHNPGSFIQFCAKNEQILLLRCIIFFAP